jgi:REP element-mobilizing transposase RayT
MDRPPKINYPGTFYHVTARGNERKLVFKSKCDRKKFYEYLVSAAQRYDTVIKLL